MQRSSSSVFSSPITRKLPDAFTDHNAPEFVRKLFIRWVEEADATTDGIIPINREKQPYHRTTVTKAIRWLKAHRLLKLAEKGGGRGVASRYEVNWLFEYKTPSPRQKAINHAKYANTGSSYKYARKRLLKLLEKHEKLLAQRKQAASLKSEKPSRKALAWAMSQVRTMVNEDFAVSKPRQREILAGIGASIWRAMVHGKLKAGPNLAEFIRMLISRLREVRSGRFGPRAWCAYAGWLVKTTIEGIRSEAAERERQRREEEERKREREEAQAHPLNELLAEEGVERISDLVKRLAAEQSPLSPDREHTHRSRRTTHKVRSGKRVVSYEQMQHHRERGPCS